MSEQYPIGDHQYSPHLGLALWGTDEVTTDNFLLIDSAVAGFGPFLPLAGNGPLNPMTGEIFGNSNFTIATPIAADGYTATFINGMLLQDASGNIIATGVLTVPGPPDTPQVYIYSPGDTFSTAGSVTLLDGFTDYVSIAAGAAGMGDKAGDYILILDGKASIGAGNGSEWLLNANFTSPLLGNFTGGWETLDGYGNQQITGFSVALGCPLIGAQASIPNGIFFFVSGAGDFFEIGNGGQGQPNFLLESYDGLAGFENAYGVDTLRIWGAPVELGYVSSNTFHTVVNVSSTAVSVTGSFVEATTHTPTSSSAAGTTGQIAWDQNYIYVCLNGSTPLWGRAALSSTGW